MFNSHYRERSFLKSIFKLQLSFSNWKLLWGNFRSIHPKDGFINLRSHVKRLHEMLWATRALLCIVKYDLWLQNRFLSVWQQNTGSELKRSIHGNYSNYDKCAAITTVIDRKRPQNAKYLVSLGWWGCEQLNVFSLDLKQGNRSCSPLSYISFRIHQPSALLMEKRFYRITNYWTQPEKLERPYWMAPMDYNL